MLFTDLVGSTELRARVGEESADRFRRTHDSLVIEAIEANGGRVVKSTGDGAMATFAGAADAVGAAIAVQRVMHDHNRRDPGTELLVRIGISAGDVTVEPDGDCFGLPVVEAQRLEGAAAPGQILCSSLVRGLARGRGAHTFRSVGELELKGLPEPVPADEVLWEPAPVDVARALPPVLVAGNDFAIAGRDGELATLQEAWQASSTGAGRLVLLGGEPGIGKTRLVRELALRVLDRGGLVLAGRSDDGLAAPYGPFVEALVWLTTLDGDAELGEYPTELVRIAPELARLAPKLSTVDFAASDGDAALTIKAIRSWLQATAAIQPTMLVLDDLHWADSASLQVLRALFDREPIPGLLVLGTYRDTELDRRHPLAGVLADLRRVECVTRLAVAGLDEEGVMAFLTGAAGHALDGPTALLASEVWAETAGNPFFVGEVLRHLVETGVIIEHEGTWSATAGVEDLGIPDGIREVVGRRLSTLADTTDQVLAAASVIGLEFDVPILAAAAGSSDDEILDALDEAQRSALVTEVRGETWRFAHAIVRDTLRSEIPNARRIRMHRTIATAIEARANGNTDAVATSLAYHWSEAATSDDALDAAIRWGRRAGDLALDRGATDDAVRSFERTLELFDPDQPADLQQGELWLRLARAHALTSGRAHRAPLFRAADIALDLDDHQLLTDALVVTNRAGVQTDEQLADPELVARLEQALDLIGTDEPVHRAKLLAAMAIELTYIGHGDRRAALCEEAIALAQATGEDDAVAAAALAYFIAMPQRLMRAEDLERAVADMDAQSTRLLRTRVDQRTVHLLAHVWHGGVLLGQPDLIRRSDHEMSALASSRPSHRVLWETSGRRVVGAIIRGDLDAAERELTNVFLVAKDPLEKAQAGGYFAQIAIERDLVAAVLPELEAAAEAMDSSFVDAWVAHTRALAGDHRGAEQALDAVLHVGIDKVADDPGWNPAMALLIETSILVGRTEVPVPLAGALERWPLPHFYNGAWYFGATARLRGNVAHLAGNDDEAIALYEQAITDHDALGAVPWLAETRLDQAQLCLDRGEPERAAAYARAALDDIGDLPLTRRKNRALKFLEQSQH